ncbi:MAG: ABC transporter transmembrane domain-containing protein, partial [Planctomycetota bacterium]
MIETTQQSGSLAQIGRLVRLGFRHPHLLVLNILGLLAMGGLSFVLVLLSQTILEVFGPVLDDAGHRFSPEELAAATDRLMELGILLTSLAVPAGLVAAGSWWIGQYLASRCVLDLRDMFMRHFVGLDMEFHAAAAKGDMITRMSGDMEQAQSVIQSVFGKTSQRPLEIIATIVAVFVVEWRLASILFLILLPVILILSRLFKRTKRRAQRARKSMAATMTAFEQAASGVRVIKSVGEEVTAANSFNATTTRLMRDEMRTVKTRAHADLVSYGIAFLIPGLTMFASIWLLRSNAISGAEVGAFLVGLIRITTMLRTTQRAFGAVMQKLPGAARIFAI